MFSRCVRWQLSRPPLGEVAVLDGGQHRSDVAGLGDDVAQAALGPHDTARNQSLGPRRGEGAFTFRVPAVVGQSQDALTGESGWG